MKFLVLAKSELVKDSSHDMRKVTAKSEQPCCFDWRVSQEKQ